MRYFMGLLLLVCFSVNASVLSELNSNNDHGIWLEETYTKRLSPIWSLQLYGQQRIGSDYRKLWQYQYEIDFILDCPVPPCLQGFVSSISLAPGYNPVNSLEKNSLGHYHWTWIHCSVMALFFRMERYGWVIDNRLRYEYDQYVRDHYSSYGIYRHLLVVSSPWGPYVSNEWFMQKTSLKYYENRFRLGIETYITARFHPAFYWQWRATKEVPGWQNSFHYGMDLRF